ncbi:SusC/RagA family TonB-linked outer membrane protein [Marixanthomonas spongiae]|uniref:SusC/RagA family TonB-linked outer membrane protein n=1 Tax=Marixanthomonas spongiae TaxID=2174845 RepID=A0A2U0I7I8_9FLAO|nr:SusC/RagA family TonB-linked outer membrane protein [Marixanthomonas spongiae]PVW17067.1 SusC/RagA family TonB-linked outer membrane protein [Marixanthomonas spongiae]
MRQKFKILLTLLSFVMVQTVFAQEKQITGSVQDASGVPLLGVNILVKGTSTGTQTDFDGNYTIEASTGETLVFSYVGYTPKEVVVGESNTIDVVLEQGEALETVVVTALGISREKKSLGYSTQQVESEELTETRPSNALNSLSGKVAGVSISSPSGSLGGSTRILLRGPGSITQENKPLIVVDGIPLDNSNYNSTSTQTGGGGRDYGDAAFDINPDDVESVNVLKGGAAAALYGSRAQNGVILITTKSGKEGKAEITVNSGVTFESVNVLPKVQKLYGGGGGNAGTIEQVGFDTAVINGTTYKIADFATDESWGPKYDGQQVLQWDNFDPEFPNDYLNPREWKYPDYDKEDFFNTGISLNNGVAFSQGSENSNMRLSVNNTQTKGIVPNTQLDKTSINFNGMSQLTDRLKVDAGVNFTVTEGFNRPAIGYTGEGVIQQLYQFGQTQLDYERLKKYKLPNGRQRTWNRTAFNDPTPRYTDNPYWTLYENTSEDKRSRWYGNLGLQYNITDELYVVSKVYADTYNLRISERTAIGSQAPSSYSESDRNFEEINYEARLHYDNKFFDDKLSLNTFVGTNRRDNEFHRLNGNTRGGLATPGIYNLNNSNNDAAVDDFDSRKRVNSVFGSASFGWDNFAYLTVTGRNDWSSTLPDDNNSYFYPSANASLVFSQLIDADWLSFGKLRGGLAQVSSDTDPYNLINTFFSGPSFFSVIQFQNSGTKLNPELKPEIKDTWEVGLEMAFFKNRLSFDLTYYNEQTSDLITPVQIDPGAGYNGTFTNAGKLENKGIEALVNITPLKSEDFRWDLTWNFAKNENELLELIEGVESLQIARFPFNGVTINGVVGEPYGVIRGTNFVYDDEGNKVVSAEGRYLETPDVENLGSVLPDFNMGLRNSFEYKGIRLSFLIDWQKGGKYRSLTNLWGNYSGILESTVTNNKREVGTVLDGVTGDVTYNDDGTYTVTNTAPNTTVIPAQLEGVDHYFGPDAINVFDADYVKLRELSLGYTLPSEWVGDLSSVRVSAFGRNLFVWGLDNDNFDPEVATSGSGNIQGSEGGSLPSTRSIGVNVELKF